MSGMGCLFSRNKKHNYGSPVPRQIHVRKISTNGSIHTNGQEHKRKQPTKNQDDVDGHRGNSNHHPVHVPPNVPVLSPRPLETFPRTPEPLPDQDRPSLNVHDAEDLQPVTPLPDVITVATVRPKQNRVDVSTVNITSTEPPRRTQTTMLSKNDVTIEDLDSEPDHYSRYSEDGQSNRPEHSTKLQPNDKSTEPLLPRRKQKNNDTVDSTKSETQEEVKPKHKKKKRKKKKETTIIISARTPEISDVQIIDLHDELIVVGNEQNSNQNSSKETNKVVENTNSTDNRMTDNKVDTRVATSANESRVSSAQSLEASTRFVPNDLFQKELEKERLKRKRKHVQQRKHKNESVNVTHESLGKSEETLKRGLKATPLNESRPGSSASVWTVGSAFSLKSQDSRLFPLCPSTPNEHVATPKSREDSQVSRFSYVPTGTTPITFKQDGYEQEAQLLDLESEYGADSTAGDHVIVSARVMDPYHNIKPYKTEEEALEKKPLDDVESGSSTSYLRTKQKLLYSRHARRPGSETYPRMEGKPPLPPGSTLKMRPSSDTDRSHMAYSRYFTTDLDIH